MLKSRWQICHTIMLLGLENSLIKKKYLSEEFCEEFFVVLYE